jgi:hypothetical protein
MIGKSGAELAYKDIITILKGPDYCEKIMRYSAAQLEQGSFRPVA